jgi:hypothetical protein
MKIQLLFQVLLLLIFILDFDKENFYYYFFFDMTISLTESRSLQKTQQAIREKLIARLKCGELLFYLFICLFTYSAINMT